MAVVKGKKKELADERYFDLVKKFPLQPIESEEQNDTAGEICANLARRFKELSAGEKAYLAVLTVLMEKFEEQWDEELDVEPRELVQFLMEQNDLSQKDLIPIFGTSSRISEFLGGKRELSINQIRGLSRKFSLSPTAFFPKEGTAV